MFTRAPYAQIGENQPLQKVSSVYSEFVATRLVGQPFFLLSRLIVHKGNSAKTMFRFKKKGDQRRRLDKNATMRPREQAIVYYSQKVQKKWEIVQILFSLPTFCRSSVY